MSEETRHKKPMLAYASRVKVEIDSQRRWIELHFNDYTTPLLALKLQALGFRTRKFSVMFRADYSRERIDYGYALEKALAESPEGPDLHLEPSIQALRTNIEKKEFSLVKISLRDEQIKSYVLFEPSKYRAELIATIFAQKHFGDLVQTVAVFPGTRLREAKLLFDEGKIIQTEEAKDQELSPINTADQMDKPNPKNAFEIRDEFYNSISGNNLDSLMYSHIKRVDFDSWIHQHYPDVSEDLKEETWRYHLVRVSTEKTVERLSKKHPIQPYTAIYNKLLKVIPDLVNHLQAGTENGKSKLNSPGMMDLSYDFLGKENEDSFVIALAHRFEQNGDLVDDPDMQIRVMPEKKIAEALTFQDQFGFKQVYFERDGKNYVYPKLKKDLNGFLNQWLSNIIEQGHRIILTENPQKIAEEKKEDEDESLNVFSQAYQLLKQVIPGFPFDNTEKIVETLLTEDNKFYVSIGGCSSGRSKLNFTQYDVEGHDIEVQYDALVYLDRQEINISFELLDNYYQSHFERDETEEEIEARDADVGEVLTGAFVQFLEGLIQKRVVIDFKVGNPCTVSADPDEDTLDKADVENAISYRSKLILAKGVLPNIIVPVGAKEPFISEGLNKGDIKAIIDEDFPHLRRLNDTNLNLANALELYYLLQAGHPVDIGLKPNRTAVLAECERRGTDFLKDLSYPTDLNYPYVNRYVGYNGVDSLREILGEKQDDWWAAVENYYPIADPEKGLLILAGLKQKLITQRDVFINPKTGKPIKAKQDLFRSLDYDVRRIDEGISVITEYIDNVKQSGQQSAVKDNGKIQVLSIYLTTEAHSRQADFSKAAIMHTWQEANVFVRAKIGINSDVYYKVTWQDGYSIEGMMDIEPPDFFNGKTNLLGSHIHTFYTNISSIIPGSDPIYGDKRLIEDAKSMIKRYQFNDDALYTEKIALSQDETNATSDIIKGLESAYWTKEDDKYPENKITINGVDFNYMNLLDALLDKVSLLPLATQMQIAAEMAKLFKERHSLASYENRIVTLGKHGEKRHPGIISVYLRDMMIDSDIWKKKETNKRSALEYLMNIMIAGEDTLKDMPTDVKRAKPVPLQKNSTPHELNKAIEHFIDEKDKHGDGFAENDKTYIAGYTGAGGLLGQGAEGRGTLYEYYTPDKIVQKMWGLAFEFGYTDGRVLEPSCGTGNFLKYVPVEAMVDAYETNHYAKRIAEILYPYATVYEKPFESIFFAGNIHLKDKFETSGYELVIGNPPYGEFTGRYAGMGEKKWTGAQLYDHYFLLRGLDLLIPGGLLVMIIPNSFLANGDKYNPVKEKIGKQARLLDAYRLPSRVFKTTDVGTDIIVLKKKI